MSDKSSEPSATDRLIKLNELIGSLIALYQSIPGIGMSDHGETRIEFNKAVARVREVMATAVALGLSKESERFAKG